MLNEKGVKCWKGSQKLVKMPNIVTIKIPLRSQFLVKVSYVNEANPALSLVKGRWVLTLKRFDG